MVNCRKYMEMETENMAQLLQTSLFEIEQRIAQAKREDSFYGRYFFITGSQLQTALKIILSLKSDTISTSPTKDLRRINKDFYAILEPEQYTQSFLNPTFSVSQYGEKRGPYFSFISKEIMGSLEMAYRNRQLSLLNLATLYLNFCTLVHENESMLNEEIENYAYINWSQAITTMIEGRVMRNYRWYHGLFERVSSGDYDALYGYGLPVSDIELKTASFYNAADEQKLRAFARFVAESFVRGFVVIGKDMSSKKTVSLSYSIGQEKLMLFLTEELRKQGLEPCFHNIKTRDINPQFNYDHRFDLALYFSEAYSSFRIAKYQEICDIYKRELQLSAGTINIDRFGEKPFSPVEKEENLKLHADQHNLFVTMQNRITAIHDSYSPNEETSYTEVALPTPAISENFEEIFYDFLDINMLENARYETIQQRLIDVLDTAHFVHVKGNGRNETDLYVKMPKLTDPERETNYDNCVADVNIPVGEVYTTPQLKGTNGLLHLERTFLEGLLYKNLKLLFKDGFITEYSCENFENKEDNEKYIRDTLFNFNETLPLGEFAIGTNTLAYVVSKKYNIMDLLPILIIEKVGPHFAIGDTCFTYEEDHAIYNRINKKEIVAKDNEKSIQRKNNIDAAYTNCHIDITLPYESIEHITAITSDKKEMPIIRKGQFVLPGTEELNRPFHQKVA